jgi:methyltransferase (TIGR00027 family)
VPEDVPSGVGATAIGVAAMRAAESERQDRLFEDPLARAFVTGAGWPRIGVEDVEPERRAGLIALSAWVSARTRFLDDLLLDATNEDVRQVVLLGAGLDARAFRLPWPGGVRVFELDTAAMLDFKQRVVDGIGARPRAQRVVIRIDLREDWPGALRAAGFDPDAPVAWVVEGLLVYLDEASVERVMDDIGALSAPGSRVGLTSSSGASIDSLRASVGEGVSSLWISRLPADPVSWMAQHGWTATVTDSRDLLAAHGRVVPSRSPNRTPAWLVDGRRY